jgi:CHAT domain-containing protein/tetratricopeptide (TPR) repeat protein
MCRRYASLAALALCGGAAGLAYPEQSQDWKGLYASGRSHQNAGDHHAALRSFERAAGAARAAGDKAGEASSIHNVAASHWFLGDSPQAIELYGKAKAIREDLGDRPGVARSWYGIAACNWSMGEPQAAIEAYRQALAVWRELKDVFGEAETRNSLGLQYVLLGDAARGQAELNTALRLWRQLHNRNREAYTLNNLALSAIGGRNHPQALDFAGRALQRLEGSEDRRAISYALHTLGNAYAALGQHQRALQYFQQSIGHKRALEDRWGAAYTLHAMGESYAALKDADRAGDYLAQALDLRRAAHDRTGQILTLGALARLLRNTAKLDEARQRIEEAVALIESRRSSLVSQDLRASYFASQRDYYDFHVDTLMAMGQTEEALTVAERARGRLLVDRLADSIAGLRRHVDPALTTRERSIQHRLNAQAERLQRSFAGPAATSGEAGIRDSVAALLNEYREVTELIRQQSPRLAELTAPRQLSAGDIRALLEPGMLLLEYFLGRQRSFLWVVSSERVDSVSLPPQAAIEKAARALVARVTAREPYAEESRALARLLLGPAQSRVARARRIVVAGDGLIEAIPFSLLLPDIDLSYLPSAPALALRRAAPPGVTSKTLALLADPAFTSAGPDLARLRFSRLEADAISALVPAQLRTVAIDTAASRRFLTATPLRDFRILHLATHALLDDRHPELSAIALSDGLLRAHEIYGWDLRARLVVLSACRSALGTPLRGEGLQSVTRGFLYAGAAAVLATLWDVDDRATAALMKRFYQELLLRHQPAGSALRLAQSAVRGTPGWEHPYYWAGFTLQGEWR